MYQNEYTKYAKTIVSTGRGFRSECRKAKIKCTKTIDIMSTCPLSMRVIISIIFVHLAFVLRHSD